MKKIYVFVLIIFLAISVYSFYAYNNEKDIEQARKALMAYPGGMQIGGGK